jgi:hypothetical protein
MELEEIMTAAELASHVAGLVASIPAAPADLTEKARWQTITVVNQTQYMLIPSASYFDSGRFWTAPAAVPPFQKMTFSVCNADFSFFTGATGAVVMQVMLAPASQAVCNLGVGFGAPWAGGFDTNAVFDADASSTGVNPAPSRTAGALAQATYDTLSTSQVNAQSGTFSGKDTQGNPTTITFAASGIPGQEAMVTVTQQITSGGN